MHFGRSRLQSEGLVLLDASYLLLHAVIDGRWHRNVAELRRCFLACDQCPVQEVDERGGLGATRARRHEEIGKGRDGVCGLPGSISQGDSEIARNIETVCRGTDAGLVRLDESLLVGKLCRLPSEI